MAVRGDETQPLLSKTEQQQHQITADSIGGTTCYGVGGDASVQQRPCVSQVSTIQSTLRKRAGKRCRNPNHRHTPLHDHHGENDPRSYISTEYEVG
eukprot:sb/3479127/